MPQELLPMGVVQFNLHKFPDIRFETTTRRAATWMARRANFGKAKRIQQPSKEPLTNELRKRDNADNRRCETLVHKIQAWDGR